MPKFSKGDEIRVLKTHSKTGIITKISYQSYYVHWTTFDVPIAYTHDTVDRNCELVESLPKNNPNVLFRERS